MDLKSASVGYTQALNLLLMFSPMLVITGFLADMVLQIYFTRAYTPRQWLLDIVSATITTSIAQMINKRHVDNLEAENQKMLEMIKLHAEEAENKVCGAADSTFKLRRPPEIVIESDLSKMRLDKGQ